VRKNASWGRFAFQSLSVVVGSLLSCANVGATVHWDGDASRGTGVFKGVERNASATVSVVTDSAQGKVWKFYKPTGSNRSEARGSKGWNWTDGKTFYFGWRYKISRSHSRLNAVFQTHGYDRQTADHPLVLNQRSQMVLNAFGDGQVMTPLWGLGSNPVNVWHEVVFRIRMGRGSDGWVEYWYNGQQQTLKTGGTRYYGLTLDGGHTEPKWGLYGAPEVSITNLVDGLRIASTYAEANPRGR
jgi:hypothetical protein